MKKNNSKDKLLAILIVLGIYFVYYVIGYLFNTEVLNAVTVRKHGMSISFVGIFMLFATSFFIVYLIKAFRK
jgi:hypothetical protein